VCVALAAATVAFARERLKLFGLVRARRGAPLHPLAPDPVLPVEAHRGALVDRADRPRLVMAPMSVYGGEGPYYALASSAVPRSRRSCAVAVARNGVSCSRY